MVIRYVPRGPIDALSARALVELSSELGPPVVLGGWMTRVWAVARGRDARVTNDLDVTYLPEVLAVPEVAAGLRRLGYHQDDRGYPFRYTRMSNDGLLIVDLLCDAEQQLDPSAQPVFGVAFATERLESFDLTVVDVGVAHVLVPAIERATVLRLLALDQGPGMVRFAPYAVDAHAVGLILADDGGALKALQRERKRDEVRRAEALARSFLEPLRRRGLEPWRRRRRVTPKLQRAP